MKILIVALQGHLFFGNIQTVVERIRSYLPLESRRRKNQFTYLVLDCSFVAGADINAISSLCKLSVRTRPPPLQ
jgi:MFS superfamily sulfate permease-like transporter